MSLFLSGAVTCRALLHAIPGEVFMRRLKVATF